MSLPEAHVLGIASEFDHLRLVLTHEPGLEILRLTPTNKGLLLFEDVPFLSRMQIEHRKFVERLEQEGVKVLYLRELARDLLSANAGAREVLVNLVCESALVPGLVGDLMALDADKLLDVFFGGLTASEAGLLPRAARSDFFVLQPIPNAYFTRDPAAVIGTDIVSCKMHHSPRVRESLIVREVLRMHPSFRGAPIVFGDRTEEGRSEDRPHTVEGGDVLVLNDQAVAVGLSERTRRESIRLLATKLFRRGLASRVYAVTIPAERIYMHLDTVFTIVAPGVAVVYPRVMDNVTELTRFEAIAFPTVTGTETIAAEVRENRLFESVLEEELGGLEIIETGGGNLLAAEREQAADGTNVLALRPGVVVTYDRNTVTNAALRDRGIVVHEIEGSELVRGLGGPRCMTMPLHRDSAAVPHHD